MAYCKFCGMDSKSAAKCDWCGRDLVTPRAQTHIKIQPLPLSTMEKVELAEERERRDRIAFVILCSALLVAAAIAVYVRYSSYPYVALFTLFAAGVLLRYFAVIPPLEDEWQDMIVPVIFLFLLPPMMVFVGYLVWQLLSRSVNFTLIWLFSVFVVILTVLQIAFSLVAPDEIGLRLWLQVRGTDVLGMAAIFFGWLCSNIVTPIGK